MPVTISGSGTITGIATGGLPDGSIAAGDLASTLDLTGKTVTLPSGTGGKILQVVSTTKTDTFTTASTSATAVTGLSASITPTTSGNKILVIASLYMSNETSNYASFAYLYKNGSVITGATGDAANSQTRATVWHRQYYSYTVNGTSSISYLDATSGTSSITYQIYISAESGSTAIIGRDGINNNNAAFARCPSMITLLEVAA